MNSLCCFCVVNNQQQQQQLQNWFVFFEQQNNIECCWRFRVYIAFKSGGMQAGKQAEKPFLTFLTSQVNQPKIFRQLLFSYPSRLLIQIGLWLTERNKSKKEAHSKKKEQKITKNNNERKSLLVR